MKTEPNKTITESLSEDLCYKACDSYDDHMRKAWEGRSDTPEAFAMESAMAVALSTVFKELQTDENIEKLTKLILGKNTLDSISSSAYIGRQLNFEEWKEIVKTGLSNHLK